MKADTDTEVEEEVVEGTEVAEATDVTEATDAETETGGEATDEAAAGEEGDENPDLLKAGEVKGLTAEAQEHVNRRIGKVTGKRRAAEADRDAAVTERDAAVARAKALEDDRELKLAAEAVRMGIHPDYLEPGEVTTLKQYDALSADEAWLAEHAEGYEAPAGGGRSYTAAEISRELSRVGRELRALAPRAEGLKASKTAQMFADMKLGREAAKAGFKAGMKLEGGNLRPAGKPRIDANGREGAAGHQRPRPVTVTGGRPGSGAAGSRPVSGGRPRPSFSPEAMEKAGGGKAGLAKLFE